MALMLHVLLAFMSLQVQLHSLHSMHGFTQVAMFPALAALTAARDVVLQDGQ
jgi:hypothetical protein